MNLIISHLLVMMITELRKMVIDRVSVALVASPSLPSASRRTDAVLPPITFLHHIGTARIL